MASFASERASFTNFLRFSLNLVDDQYSDGKSDHDLRALSRSKVIYCAGSVYIYIYKFNLDGESPSQLAGGFILQHI